MEVTPRGFVVGLILVSILIGVSAVTIPYGYERWTGQSWPPWAPPAEPIVSPPTTPAPPGYQPVAYSPKLTFTYRGGTAANGETVYFYLPNADKSYWTLIGTSYTVADGSVTGPAINEYQTFKVHVVYNSTTPLQDQYKEYVMPRAPEKWTQSYLNLGDFEVKRAPTDDTVTYLYLRSANGSMISTDESAPSGISLGAASYPKVNQPLKLTIKLDEAWRNLGGAWSQPATSLGTTAKDFVSDVKFSINKTTGYTWTDEEWSMISGPSTTRNYTTIFPELVSKTSRDLPVEYDMYLHIDWSGSASGTVYTLRVEIDDTQIFSQVTAGSTTVRSAPNAGRLHTDSAVYYIEITD